MLISNAAGLPAELLTEIPVVTAASEESDISGSCGVDLSWSLDDYGMFRVTGTGAMDDYLIDDVPWKKYLEQIKTVYIDHGAETVGANAFAGAKALQRAVLPYTLKSLEAGCFEDCEKLEAFSIPDSLDFISETAFAGCSRLVLGCRSGSYAAGFAEEYGISFYISDCGDDLTWSYDSGLLTVTGTNGCRGEIRVPFTIPPYELNIPSWAITLDYGYSDMLFDGHPKEPAVDDISFFSAALGRNISLEAGKDFTAEYSNNIRAGSNASPARAEIVLTGNYSGRAVKEFTILPGYVFGARVLVDAGGMTGEEGERPLVSVMLGDVLLEENVDYTVDLDRCGTTDGAVTVFVTGIGSLSGEVSRSCKLGTASLSDCTVTLDKTSFDYNGEARCPAVTVKQGSKVLEEDTDYLVSYYSNIGPGIAKAVVTGINDFSGSCSCSFVIEPWDITVFSLELGSDTMVYTGAELRPAVTVTNGSEVLEEGVDYTLSFSGNVSAGEAKVTAYGKGKYGGTLTDSFTVLPKPLAAGAASFAQEEYPYELAPIMPEPVVKDGEKLLKGQQDYTVSYSGNTIAGTATAVIKGKGNYCGTLKKSFTVSPAELPEDGAVLEKDEWAYTGSAVEPAAIVSFGGRELKAGTDYTVTYRNNISSGNAVPGAEWYSIRVSEDPSFESYRSYFVDAQGSCIQINDGAENGKTLYVMMAAQKLMDGALAGEYCEAKKIRITEDIGSVSFGKNNSFTYNGKSIQPKPTVRGVRGSYLSDEDYTVSYYDNDQIGSAFAVVVGKGDFSGAKTARFPALRLMRSGRL